MSSTWPKPNMDYIDFFYLGVLKLNASGKRDVVASVKFKPEFSFLELICGLGKEECERVLFNLRDLANYEDDMEYDWGCDPLFITSNNKTSYFEMHGDGVDVSIQTIDVIDILENWLLFCLIILDDDERIKIIDSAFVSFFENNDRNGYVEFENIPTALFLKSDSYDIPICIRIFESYLTNKNTKEGLMAEIAEGVVRFS